EREAFRLTVVPAEAAEHADIVRDFLIPTDPHTVFQRSIFSGRRNVGRRAGRRAQLNRLGIIPGLGAVLIGKHPDGAFMPVNLVKMVDLVDSSLVYKDSPVESRAVGGARHERAREAEPPVGRVELVNQAPGVAASIGGVTPGAVVHGGPAHELPSRIM